jgi:DNA (cytosine-5)-methyltransferase 1
MKKRKALRAIDLFAGCGGLSEGFEKSGLFNVLAHVEWERAPVATLRRRIEKTGSADDAERRVMRFDMQRSQELFDGWSDDLEYGSGVGLTKLVEEAGGVDVIIGGPPCQAYSLAGRVRDEHGMHLDYRNYLFEKYVEVVGKYQPDAFVFENVPGMLTAAPGGISIVDRIKSAFDAVGYEILGDLKRAAINLWDYGVPQHRTRVIILGLNRKKFPNHGALLEHFYNELLPTKRCAVVSAGEALEGLPDLLPAKSPYRARGRQFSHTPDLTEISDHVPRFHNQRDIATFRMLAKDLLLPPEKRKYPTVEDIRRLYEERTGKTSAVHKYFVIRPGEPSNTIPAHLYKDGLRHIHWDPDQARSITVREAARLQSFPDDFEFVGAQMDAYKMIGNAVPPVFSRILADSVAELLSSAAIHPMTVKKRSGGKGK